MIYLDHMASTPVAPEVNEAIVASLKNTYGNPHADHSLALRAQEEIDRASEDVAGLIGGMPGEITFTSGASEANNQALKGAAWASVQRGRHIIVSAIEHSCVLEAAHWLQSQGFNISYVSPDNDGVVQSADIVGAMRDDTILVSIQLVNNEIGTVQPVAEVAQICRERGVAVHTDAAQAVGKIAVDVQMLGVDMLSMSGHKLYGPKGIGALWISADSPVRPVPLVHGGGQQGGRRGGTVPTFLCCGLGTAARVAKDRLVSDGKYLTQLTSYFSKELKARVPDMIEHAGTRTRVPGCLSVRFTGIEGQFVLMHLQRQLAASTGSACSTGLQRPSHVLTAMGLSPDAANSTIRFGLGRSSTKDELLIAAQFIAETVANARNRAA